MLGTLKTSTELQDDLVLDSLRVLWKERSCEFAILVVSVHRQRVCLVVGLTNEGYKAGVFRETKSKLVQR